MSANGWEVAAAVGTIAGAAATLAAVAAALITGARDRRAAAKAINDQLAAAQRRQSQEHELELLLRLADHVAIYLARQGSPQQREAAESARNVVLALPDASDLYAARTMFCRKDDFKDMPSYREHYDEPEKIAAPTLHERARHEIAARIRQVASQ